MAEPPGGRRPSAPITGPRRRVPGEGVLEVFVADEQSAVPVDVTRWGDLARRVLEAEGIRGDAELSLLFVSNETMAELNERFMDTAGSTDVLAFPIEEDVVELGRWPDATTTGPDRSPPDAGDAPLLLGDVVIAPAVAAEQAGERQEALDDELALLVVHGILHVLGMDHADPEQAAAMRARERELLSRFHKGSATGTGLPDDGGNDRHARG